MKRNSLHLQNPIVFFAAGFFVGLFVKFLPFFIIALLIFLVAGGICRFETR